MYYFISWCITSSFIIVQLIKTQLAVFSQYTQNRTTSVSIVSTVIESVLCLPGWLWDLPTWFPFHHTDSKSLFSIHLPKCLSNYVTSCYFSVQHPAITFQLIQSEIQNQSNAEIHPHLLFIFNLSCCCAFTPGSHSSLYPLVLFLPEDLSTYCFSYLQHFSSQYEHGLFPHHSQFLVNSIFSLIPFLTTLSKTLAFNTPNSLSFSFFPFH